MNSHGNPDSGKNEPQTSHSSGGPMGWLFHPARQRFLLPATGIWILALDWVLFSSNLLSAWLATPIVMVVGFLLGGTGTFLAQRRAAKDSLVKSVWKALLAGVVVGLPWPVAGTLLGGGVLLASGLADARKSLGG